MSSPVLVIIILLYFVCLFFIALWAEKNAKSKWVNNPYIYTLSLAVYCSAWTYYGSVGIAASSGIHFLTIYLGPLIAFPLWIVIMRKMIRISKQQKISSIADFISLRYGNSRTLGALVTLICLIGIVPYISLQLKALSETFEIITHSVSSDSTTIFKDLTFYIAVLLALFTAFFGTQKTDASERKKGIIASIAFESIIKLIFFLIIGIYVTYFVFDGPTAIYNQITTHENFKNLTTLNGLEAGLNWFFMILLSFLAIFLLPRQFHVAVVENDREKYLKKSIWLFPLYLLLFNLFVIFIAWGGLLTISPKANPDYFSLLIPLENNHIFLACLVFFGGFSAIISMILISTLALSTMLSNNLIIPYGFISKLSQSNQEKNATYIKNIRRISIFSLIIFAYFFYVLFSVERSLFSIGLMSFTIIAQLAPAFLIGLFWNRGTSKAAIIGILVGFGITTYTLIAPFITDTILNDSNFSQLGPWGITALKPYQLFGIDFLSPAAHSVFWSLFFNLICYLYFSLSSKVNYRERNYAEMIVNNSHTIAQENSYVWKGEAYVDDIRNVLNRFLGEYRTERALNLFYQKHNISKDIQMANAKLINFAEKLLTGSIGSASAKILISNVVKEEEISIQEVLKILEESKETISTNRILKEQSNQLTALTHQLKEANKELQLLNLQKDDFLDTVAHELKTPLTSIRAASEVLMDHDMPSELKQQFLKNILYDSDRLSRLINNILDLEKLASGREQLDIQEYSIQQTLHKVINGIAHIASTKEIQIKNTTEKDFQVFYDEDRIIQVMTNLISNALKFCEPKKGFIQIYARKKENQLYLSVQDNGKGIPTDDIPFIFDKFYQSKNQNIKKPLGSGFGLAICKRIIESHKGVIWADSTYTQGAKLEFKIPCS
ncbi:sensor protein [Flavobacteriaceae bacterium UJ101]|nr:sensor protein [Flavobacteriaceae bacterium UJ101]